MAINMQGARQDASGLVCVRDAQVSPATIKDPRIRQILHLLENGERRFCDVASSLNMSSSRLRHLFKEELGVSPGEYLRLLRLQRAKELLETSSLRVKEVAALIGINDISHFVRHYKVHYGETPSETRRHQQTVSCPMQPKPPRNSQRGQYKVIA